MSKDWTQGKLQAASKAMKAVGHLGYEEFRDQHNNNQMAQIIKEVLAKE